MYTNDEIMQELGSIKIMLTYVLAKQFGSQGEMDRIVGLINKDILERVYGVSKDHSEDLARIYNK